MTFELADLEALGAKAVADFKESVRTGKTVRQLCRERKILPEKELERALDPISMTEPGGTDAADG